MNNDKIREDFLKDDVRDFTSVFNHNGEYRYQYVDYLESAMQSAQEEIERLKNRIDSIFDTIQYN